MSWWSWMILGAILLGAELLAIDAQFFLVFIGLSAALTGVFELTGIAMPAWAQWLTFATLSLVSMFTFRKRLYEKLSSAAQGFQGSLTGESMKVSADLAPNAEARMEHRGSEWTVVNVGADAIESGSRASIVKVEGLTLHIRADQAEA